MAYMDKWRAAIPANFAMFRELLANDSSISIPYGLVCGALLWHPKNEITSSGFSEALSEIFRSGQSDEIREILVLLQHAAPLAAAQTLSRQARARERLRIQLDHLLEFFRNEWLNHQFLKPASPTISISGSIQGNNVVIGGVQYVAGDFILSQYVVQQKIRVCPRAPNPPTHFAGRRSELEQLKSALSAGRSMAITGIQGMGGIGKTALALQAASEFTEFSVVLWASLGPRPNPTSHLISWAQHADPDFEVGENSVEIIASRVQALLTELICQCCPGRVLLILDDIWEGDSVAAARILQRAAPKGTVSLVTTRSQLVVSQLRSTRLELNPLSKADAVEMLRKLLADFPAIADEVLIALSEVVGYHPLAIELAAGQVALLERPEVEIVDLIATYERGLPAGSPFREIKLELGEAREDNLEVVLSFSYISLSESDRECFKGLGVLAYGVPFDQSICQALWEVEPKSTLDSLRHRALIGVVGQPGWYQQHGLLRAYARALLNRGLANAEELVDRYSEHVVGITDQFNTLSVRNWNRLEPYLPHVEAVGALLVPRVEQSIHSDRHDASCMTRALKFALNSSRWLGVRRELQHQEWLEMGLAISQIRREVRHAVTFLNELGRERFFRGDARAAIKHWFEAQKIAEAAADEPSIAFTSKSIGIYFLSADPDEAPDFFHRALKLFKKTRSTVGEVDTLIHLAEWHALSSHSYERREEGVPLLQDAIMIAESAGYEEGKAWATLKLGRLKDTLGDRTEAIELLSDALDEFKALNQRDGEAVSHLFRASALANLTRYDESRSHLENALPLFISTGDRTGQAVVLRNIAELEALAENRVEALDRFSEALPLLRKQTMRFLDEDALQSNIAAERFGARLENVVKLELIEQSRALAFEGLAQEDAGEGKQGASGFMPDEVLRYLLAETVRVNSARLDLAPIWAQALEGFATRLAESSEVWESESRFARTLRDITLNRSSTIPESDWYFEFRDPLLDRIYLKKTSPSAPILSSAEIERCVNNSLIVRISQEEKLSEWLIELRRGMRNARQWGDICEYKFYDAIVATLNDQLVALPDTNPYQEALEKLFGELGKYEKLPLDYFLERTVYYALQKPRESGAWMEKLASARRDAERAGRTLESEFLNSLVGLFETEQGVLPTENPYSSSLERAKLAIADEKLLIIPLPLEVLHSFMQALIAAKTTKPKMVDLFAEDVARRRDQAQHAGSLEDVALYNAILNCLDGQAFRISPSSLYREVVDQVATVIRAANVAPADKAILPETHVERLVEAALGALTGRSEPSRVLGQFQVYRRRLGQRDMGWQNEREFLDGLIALLERSPKPLSMQSPYREVLETLTQEVCRHEALRSKGGKIALAELDALLQKTASCSQGPMNFMKEKGETDEGFVSLLGDPQLAELVRQQGEWKVTLGEMREDLEKDRDVWKNEIDLLTALISVVQTQPASLHHNNPYHERFREMLLEMNYEHGMPVDMHVAAIASSKDEFSDYISGLFSGKSQFVKQLDTVMMNTVVAMTLMPEKLAGWAESLERGSQALAQQNQANLDKVGPELELMHAFQSILRRESPTLGDTHPYKIHLRKTLESINIFHQTDLRYTFTGKEIQHFYVMTAGVLTIASDRLEAWVDTLRSIRAARAGNDSEWRDAVAFVDALLIVLEGRPTDLPLENPYRPFLRLTQIQTRQLQERQAESGSEAM